MRNAGGLEEDWLAGMKAEMTREAFTGLEIRHESDRKRTGSCRSIGGKTFEIMHCRQSECVGVIHGVQKDL